MTTKKTLAAAKPATVKRIARPSASAVASAVTKSPKAPGRPKKAEADKLEQFSIRLPPKLKFALDLLARAQHRSLSQAVEWALQVGVNNYEVGYAGGDGVETIGSVVERAWASDRESDRLIAIYNWAPSLLSFEDFKTCEMVERSREWEQAQESDAGIARPENMSDAETYRKWEEERATAAALRKQIYYDFVHAGWKLIRFLAIERANAGKSTQEVGILRSFGISKVYSVSDFAVMEAMTKHLLGENITPDEFAKLVLEFNEKLTGRKHAP